jgi:AraC-like DNA-binding protein
VIASPAPNPLPALPFTFAAGDVFTSEFRLPPGHPGWSRASQTTSAAVLIAFPRVPVAIRHETRSEVIADSLSAVLYSPGQAYSRRLVVREGDDCTIVAVTREVAAEAARAFDPAATDPLSFRFPFVAAAVSRRALLAVQSTRAAIAGPVAAEEDEIRERLLWVVGEVVASGYRDLAAKAPARATTKAEHRDIARAVCEHIGRDMTDQTNLDDLAAHVNVSPFHLARLFRAQTGTSIHAYRTELRVRAALTPIADGQRLADVAQQMGFASHAHLTDRFTRAFGVTPVEWRAALRSRRETSTIMEAKGRAAFLA